MVEKYFEKIRAAKTTPASHQLVKDAQGQTIHELRSRDTDADQASDTDKRNASASHPIEECLPEISGAPDRPSDAIRRNNVPADIPNNIPTPAAQPRETDTESSDPNDMAVDKSNATQLGDSLAGGSAVSTDADGSMPNGKDGVAEIGGEVGIEGSVSAAAVDATASGLENSSALMDIDENSQTDRNKSPPAKSPKLPGFYHNEEREACIAKNRELMRQLGLIEDWDELVEELRRKKKEQEKAEQGKKKTGGKAKGKENVKEKRRSTRMTKAIPAGGFEPWMIPFRDMFSEAFRLTEHTDLAALWCKFETLLGPQDSKKVKLTTTGRPQELADWIQRRRPLESPPPINDASMFGECWRAWWKSMQPGTRGGEGWPLERTVEVSEEWSKLLKGGLNGFMLVPLTIVWWMKAPQVVSKREECLQALADVAWVLEEMVTMLRARREDIDQEEDQRPRKR